MPPFDPGCEWCASTFRYGLPPKCLLTTHYSPLTIITHRYPYRP
jgi:hypothetical protein